MGDKRWTQETFWDMLSLRAFHGEVPEWTRQEFAAALRIATEEKEGNAMSIEDNWKSFKWTHPQLRSKEELYQLEQELEQEMRPSQNIPFTSYQQRWVDNDHSLGFKYPSVLAEICRALRCSTEWTTHTDFVLDIIAPFYCSLVYRMMKDAEQKGIRRLYFCARDAYMMYLIAKKYQPLFPNIESHFLYISRQALYKGNDEAKIAYYKSVGLATENDYVGIVDIRSSGRTLVYLNNYLTLKGYKSVRGYYYELFCGAVDIDQDYFPTDYYFELSDRYDMENARILGSASHVFETFFPLNTLSKTIDYAVTSSGSEPVFESIDGENEIDADKVYVEDKAYWASIHEQLIISFTDKYLKSGLYRYSNEVFEVANQTLFDFLRKPQREYLSALKCLYGYRWNSGFLPYIRKESWLRLLFTKGKDSMWKQGTLAFNNFEWFHKLYRRIRYE